MEVLKGKKNQDQSEMTQEKRDGEEELLPVIDLDQNLDGQNLLDQVVSLSGLPEDLAHQELNQILRLSEMASPNESLTLEDLRSAMLVYLEQLALEQEKNDLMQHLH